MLFYSLTANNSPSIPHGQSSNHKPVQNKYIYKIVQYMNGSNFYKKKRFDNKKIEYFRLLLFS